MEFHQLCANINTLPVRALVAVMRALNNGPLGYDFSKRSKSDLQIAAHHLANERYSGGDYTRAWEEIQAFLHEQREKSDGGAEGTTITRAGMADKTDESLPEPPESGDFEGDLNPPGGGEETGESRASGPDKGDGKAEGKPGEQKAKGDKPKKEPSTPEEKLADALKQLMGQGDKPEPLTPEQIEAMIQKAMEEKAQKNVFRVEVANSDPLMPALESDERPRHEVFKEVLHAINQGMHVLLVGPAGVGKTHLSEQVAEALGKKFRFTGAVASEYKLLGFITANGTPVRTEYREAYEHGAVFLWDEIDASAAQAMLSFNAGLSNGHQDFPDAIVRRHPDFRAIASANTYGTGADRQYVGRNQLDAASLDRFYVIDMDYDSELEKSLYGNGEWVRYVQAARKAVRKLGLRHVVSMRAMDMGLRMFKTGISRGDIERAVLWKHLRQDDVLKVKKEMGLV